jgi:homoserine kinase
LLPERVKLEDAVFNLGRSALLVAALASGRPELLNAATDDRLHQLPRCRLFPAMPMMFEAAREAGALGACLSGAGSTVLALTTHGEAQIAAALESCAERNAIQGSVRVVSIRHQGAEIFET